MSKVTCMTAQTAERIFPWLISEIKSGGINYTSLSEIDKAYYLAEQLQEKWKMRIINVNKGKRNGNFLVRIKSVKAEEETGLKTSEFVIEDFYKDKNLSYLVAGICESLEREGNLMPSTTNEIHHTKTTLRGRCKELYS